MARAALSSGKDRLLDLPGTSTSRGSQGRNLPADGKEDERPIFRSPRRTSFYGPYRIRYSCYGNCKMDRLWTKRMPRRPDRHPEYILTRDAESRAGQAPPVSLLWKFGNVSGGTVCAPVLHSRQKIFTDDGGHRGFSPQDTLKKLANHVSPVTGIVSNLYPSSSWAGEDSLVPTYATVHNFVKIFSGGSSEVDFLQSSLQASVTGKGKRSVQAQASALCESIERYSGVFQGDEARF